MAIRAQSKPHQPVMLRFEDGVAPNRGGPPLGSWQDSLPAQSSIEGTFPKPIIAQGLAAYQRGKVRSLNLRRADIVATVADEHPLVEGSLALRGLLYANSKMSS